MKDKALRALVEGMRVSVDVSTGEHDAGHRIFGTITEAMDDPDEKHGVILLVQAGIERNFDAPPQASLTGAQRADIQKVIDCLDPDDWCGDESIITVLTRVLAA